MYDFAKQRWTARPYGLRWSDMVLGRMATHRTLLRDGEVLVSCYVYDGVRRYTDPVTKPESKAGPGVLYRVRVRLKETVHA